MALQKKIDCVILGLLSHESLTGYEIKKRMDTTLQYFWGASYGSIYPTLTSLVELGYTTSNAYKEHGRNKIMYTITKQGRMYLQEWLQNPVERDEVRYETLLKLFFGSEAGASCAISHIEAFEAKSKEALPYFKQSIKVLDAIKEQEQAHLYYLLTAKFGEKVYEAYIAWCEEAKEILKGV